MLAGCNILVEKSKQTFGRRGFAEILPEDDHEREVRTSSRRGVREVVSQSEAHLKVEVNLLVAILH